MIPIEPTDAAERPDLVDRYLAGDAFLVDRLGGPPTVEGLRAAAPAILARSYDRPALVRSLLAAHRELDPPESTLASIRALEDPGTLIIATGQQPGLLTGPLYTIWKAVSAIALARVVTAAGIARCVPLYWVASDDHDLPEVEGCQLLNQAGEVRRFRLSLEPARAPSAFVAVPADAGSVIEEFLAEIPDGPHHQELRDVATPRPGERWPAWFSRVLLALFPDDGLIVFEPFSNSDLIRPWLDRELTRLEHVPSLLERGAQVLAREGLDAPLPHDRPSALFAFDGESRQRVSSPAQAAAAVDAHGQAAVSADAGLRPAIQSLVLPTLAYVGGPGELRYWLQLTELFRDLDLAPPVFWPRLSVTLVEARVRRALDSLDVGTEALFAPPEEPGEDDDASAIDPAWQRDADAVESAVAALVARMTPLGGSVPRRAADLEKSVNNSLGRLLRTAADQERERSGVSRRKRQLVANAGRPGGKPQERVLNALPFLARADLDFYSRVAASIDPTRHDHLRIDVEPRS